MRNWPTTTSLDYSSPTVQPALAATYFSFLTILCTKFQANNVIVLFRLVDNVIAGTFGEDGAVAAMTELTVQAQESGSTLYSGLVTDRIDPSWGVVAVSLDVSLRLTMAIEVIGGSEVQEG